MNKKARRSNRSLSVPPKASRRKSVEDMRKLDISDHRPKNPKFAARIGMELNKAMKKNKTKSQRRKKSSSLEHHRKSRETHSKETSKEKIEPAPIKSCEKEKEKEKEPTEEPEIPTPNKIEGPIHNLLLTLGQNFGDVSKEQWEYVETVEFLETDCSAFLEHLDCNQDEEVELLDSNRVKLEKRESDYIHASYVQLKGIPRKFVLAQLPLIQPKRLADFWIMVHQEKMNHIYLLCSPDESSKCDGKKFSELFPIYYGDHETHEEVWIHNRKVQAGWEDVNDNYCLEVLPKGSSDAVRVNLQLLNYWAEREVAANRKKFLASVTSFVNIGGEESEPIGIVSKKGAGRAGTYLAIVCAIYFMKNGNNFSLKEICRSIRQQRPGAIDNYYQFVFIYSTILHYAVQNVTDSDLKMRIQKVIQQTELILYCRTP